MTDATGAPGGHHLPQDQALLLQLQAIVGDEPDGSYVEVRPYDRNTGRVDHAERAFEPVRHLEWAALRCIVAAEHGLDAYIGVAPRVRMRGRAEDVERVWTLWADCDNPDAVLRLAQFRPLPAIVVRTSPDKVHAYWPLRSAAPPAWAQRANHRLRLALGGDNVTDVARVLRAAGTLNHKSSPPTPVTCTRCEPETFTLPEVVAGCEDDPRYQPRSSPTSDERVRWQRGNVKLDGLIATVRTARQGNRNNALFWAACRLAEHVAAGTIDEHEGTRLLYDAAVAAGIPERDIDKTLSSALRSVTA